MGEWQVDKIIGMISYHLYYELVYHQMEGQRRRTWVLTPLLIVEPPSPLLFPSALHVMRFIHCLHSHAILSHLLVCPPLHEAVGHPLPCRSEVRRHCTRQHRWIHSFGYGDEWMLVECVVAGCLKMCGTSSKSVWLE